MATSQTTSLPMWLTGCTYDGNGGNDLRNSGITALYFDPAITTGSTIGLRGGVVGGAGLFVIPGTGMNIAVQPGSFVVPNTANPIDGGYASTLASQATLSVATADPTNPRIDIIVAYVSDVGTSASFGAVSIITGTAAPSPSAPTAPANSITLAQLSVPAATTSITSGLLTDSRPFTTTAGGVLKAPKGSVSGYVGQIAFDPGSGAFYHNTNISSNKQLKVLPWAPATAYTTTDTSSSSGAQVTVASVNVTVDGLTDIEIYLKTSGIAMSATHGEFGATLQAYIDGTLLDQLTVVNPASDGVVRGGAAFSVFTSASQATTPSAGTHTVSFRFQGIDATGFFVSLHGASTAPAVLRVSPVSL